MKSAWAALGAAAGILLAIAIGPGCRSPVAAAPERGEAPAFQEAYRGRLASIDAQRLALAARGRPGALPADDSRALLLRALRDDILPFWYGTRWAPDGATDRPGAGTIAASAFVATVLRDAGLRVDRDRLARQSPQWLVMTLTREPHVRRYRSVPAGEFLDAVRQWGEGVFVVGLDDHCGLLLNSGGAMLFVHACPRRGVVREDPADSRALARARYRVIGRISADEDLLRKWLDGEPLATYTDELKPLTPIDTAPVDNKSSPARRFSKAAARPPRAAREGLSFGNDPIRGAAG